MSNSGRAMFLFMPILSEVVDRKAFCLGHGSFYDMGCQDMKGAGILSYLSVFISALVV